MQLPDACYPMATILRIRGSGFNDSRRRLCNGLMVAPVILAAVAFIAGHPTSVVCDADVNHGPVAERPGLTLKGWTAYGGNVIHVLPGFCSASTLLPGAPGFPETIELFIHEAAHARGIVSESCAELTADMGVFDVLRRFYGVPFFSPLSVRVGRAVLAHSREAPADYQPELCWNA